MLRQFVNLYKGRLAGNRQTIQSVAALFGGNMTSAILGVTGGLIIARILGPGDLGLFQSFAIPLRWLAFLHLGTFDGLWRQIPYYNGKNMPEKVESLASGAGAWNVTVSVVISAGFILCAAYCLLRRDYYGALGWFTQAVVSWTLFYGGYLATTYRTINQFVTLARVQFIQSVVNFLLIACLPFLLFFGLCLRALAQSLTGVIMFHRNRPMKIGYHFHRKALAEVIKIGFPFSFWGTLYTSAWIATESALMLYFGGVTMLGYFSIAMVMREGINVLPQAVNQVMMPRIVETFAREESVRKTNRATARLTAGLVLFMILVVMGVSYCLDIIVPIAFPKYVGGIALMKLCLWFAVVETASLPLNTLFATGRPWLMGRGIVGGIIVFLTSAYLLIPVFGGMIAIAAGSLLGRAVRILLGYAEIARLVHIEHQTVPAMEY